jgi:hypothetical protein
MSGLLHPVGPEPSGTYWLRRLLVIAATGVVAAVVGLLFNGSQDAPVVAAVPPSATPTVSTATPSRMPAAESSTSAATVTASPSPSGTPTPAASLASTEKAKSSASSRARIKKKAGATSCAPAALRATLTGQEKLKVRQAAVFQVSLINGGKTSCRVQVSNKNFKLTIYSGRDRIWTTNDCATALKPIRSTLAVEQAVEWHVAWDGRRSAAACKDRPEIPRPGTYLATAQLSGGHPVQLRMLVKK